MSTEGKNAVAYYRVSTKGQEISKLGLESQKAIVEGYCKKEGLYIIGEFTETGSGKRVDRNGLADALALIKKMNATLVVSKIDRLTRNYDHLRDIINAEIDFVAVDSPIKDKMMLRMYGVVAETERDLISQRTKSALAVVKEKQNDGKEHPEREGKKCIGRPKGIVRENQEQLNADIAKIHKENYMNRIDCLRYVLLKTYGMKIREVRKKVEESGYRSRNGKVPSYELIKKYIVDLGIAEEVEEMKGRWK